MERKQIHTINLENRLVLNIYDESRKVAGDRWMVRCTAEIEIPVDCAEDAAINMDDLKACLGEKVLFQQKRERIFIDEKEKDQSFAEMCEAVMKTSLPYLSHKDFGPKYVLKQYREKEQKKSWFPPSS
jgi:hypothetical protein